MTDTRWTRWRIDGIPWPAFAGWGLGLASLALALFWPAREAGIITDFTGHQIIFETGARLGWWNSYGWHGNQPVLFGLMKAWYDRFGIRPMPWFWLFTLWHAVLSLLAGLVAHRVFRLAAPANALPAAMVLSLFFLAHPYSTETVIWKVCLHYLLSATVLFGLLLFLFRPAPPEGWLAWFLAQLAFLAALLSLEISLIFPVILFVSAWWWGRMSGWPTSGLRTCLQRLALPQVALIAGYLVWNRIRMGAWVGHYGDQVHLGVGLPTLAGRGLQYLLKYAVFSRNWPYPWRAGLNGWLEAHTGGALLIVLVLALGLVWFGLRFVRGTPLDRTLLWAAGMFPLAVAPVLSLYVAWLHPVENDRYGYLAGFFFLLAFQALVLRWPRRVVLAVWLVWGGIALGMQQANISRWAQAQRVYDGLMSDWRWSETTGKVFVLGLPDDVDGIFILRSFRPGEMLTDALTWYAGKPPRGQLVELAAYHAVRPIDGLEVDQVDDRTFAVRFRQWGNWFLRAGLGASDYRGDGFAVAFHPGGYTVTFDQPDPDRILVYADGGHWRQVVPKGS